jgi:hypothetical protein
MSNDAYQYQWYSVTYTHEDDEGNTVYFPDSLAAVNFGKTLDYEQSHAQASQKYPGKWYVKSTSGAFYAQGILNQFIYVNPKEDLIMVRQGEKWDNGYLWLFDRLEGKW